jgi:SpoVK/Ycf46/Vps4 family AAA+-type ATPase
MFHGTDTRPSGPPGVGKTLTAEALSEDLERPLYAVCLSFPLNVLSSPFQVSSGELPIDAKLAEEQLSRIFRQAEHWKAVLLLDEADVFMRKRSLDHASNTHITMFLRMLEYYRGIMFLTTNRVNDFDPAMQSRIHLAIKYPPLSKETRKSLWTCFLEQDVQSTVNNKELNKLTEKKINGRQVR